ncbi:MAG: ribose-phosphate pyrophosphokinase-like domain-containing protein, partial [Oscillospiraceae bacterium]|nr:ribose-phosphate pyrophosphokinase-like domain-containing protein [Oscillospiraceae bacterium]
MKNHEKASELIFNKKKQVAPLSLIAIPGTEDLAKRIDYYLVKWWNQNAALYDGETVDTFLTEAACPRFSSGDGKALIKKSVRGDDVYIVADVGNYSEEYEFFGQKNRMSPDDHYQNLKRIIQAAAGKAHRINVIMPLLYGGRQHRRAYRESLDCAVALQELQAMSVENVVTFDAHDPRVCNAVPLMGFDNIIPYYQILKAMFTNIEGFTPNKDHFMVVSPDQGALDRNEYYASTLGVDLSVFSKRRDYSRIENGRNPIVAHDYLGVSPEGKDIFI